MAHAYRADGLRGLRDLNGTRTYYLYDGGNAVVELTASGSAKAVSVHAPDGLVARKSANVWTQYVFDPQGSVAQRLTGAGAVASSAAYDAYGADLTGSGSTDAFGWNGRWGYLFDQGLYLCQNRFYDPQNGRWLTRDPIGFAGGVNVYGYCAGGPVGNADPSGLKVYIVQPGGGAVDPRDENEIRRQLKLIGAPGSPTQQMMYDLIVDKRPHYISPLGPGVPPEGAQSNGEYVFYDPWNDAIIRYKGENVPIPCGGGLGMPTDIPFHPDSNLAHELGHQPTDNRGGRLDPGWRTDPGGINDYPAGSDDNVGQVENPYRAWRGYPRRARY